MWIKKEDFVNLEVRLKLLEGKVAEFSHENEGLKAQIGALKERFDSLSLRKNEQKQEKDKPDSHVLPDFKPKHMFYPEENYKGGN